MKPNPPSAGKGKSEKTREPKTLPEPKVDDPGNRFPIVGIGASAGGLAAFEAFFAGMPADVEPGMAFVLVQHLAPDHKSILTYLIQRYTRMKVHEVEDGMKVEINSAYIIPPGRDMAFLNGSLHLLEPAEARGYRLPIDFFFRSLASDQHERAIGIVLSGTGSDGSLGLRAIKAEGGMVMAQTPDSTEFGGMPRSAIATGLMDYELPPGEMPAQLMAYVAQALGKLTPGSATPPAKIENALRKVFILLRAQTGHDFSLYKPSTINRRIERRMAVNQITEVGDYVLFLQQSSVEVEALFYELLIGVTGFFRDPEVFKVLEHEVIPKIFASKAEGAVVRVWSAGCSTGEEAYSLAILLLEHIEMRKQNYSLQIFATDIDDRSIAAARTGLYTPSIAGEMTPERLSRYFSSESNGSAYRVRKSLRDVLIFSEQDVIKDPPFSKLDLITCRNLLIYLGPELQRKLIPLFHYSLNPAGWLVLGTSEGIGDFDRLFRVEDRKAKFFQRQEDTFARKQTVLGRFLPSLSPLEASVWPSSARVAKPGPDSLRELTETALLAHVVAAGVLVNAQGDILYLHGRSGMFLEPAPGETGINNVLKMAREGLRRELVVSLRKAVGTKGMVSSRGLRVKTNGHHTTVNLTIRPVVNGSGPTAPPPRFLIILEEAPTITKSAIRKRVKGEESDVPEPRSAGQILSDAEVRIAVLEAELLAKEDYLQGAIEELETSTEELKSSSEEMQSVNEELQSANEELETSKEELQSVNEELSTVNTELQTKVTDLSRANNDMNNLLAGTGIGTVFVDHRLRILRFTPAASTIINLIQTDVGRPVAHLVSNLVGYRNLVADVQAVLDTLISKEVSVETIEGRNYVMRIQPYRTLDNVIEGAVISFVDVTELVKSRVVVGKANELLRLAVVVRDSHDAITVQDLRGHILAWNPGAVRMYGWSEAEALRLNVRDRIPEGLRSAALVTLEKLSRADVLEPYRTERITKVGSILDVSIVSTALINDAGEMYAIATTERALKGVKL